MLQVSDGPEIRAEDTRFESLFPVPCSGSLVAHHPVIVYQQPRGGVDWTPFFSGRERLRDEMLENAGSHGLAALDRGLTGPGYHLQSSAHS